MAQSVRKPWKLSLGTTTLKSFVSHTGLQQTLKKLDDLEKYWANDVIKSPKSESIYWCDSVEIKLKLLLNYGI